MVGTYGVGGVPGEPDGGEVAPAELGLHDVGALLEGVAGADGVVPAAAVVLRALVLGGVDAAVPVPVGGGRRLRLLLRAAPAPRLLRPAARRRSLSHRG